VSDSFIHGTILPVILFDQWEKSTFGLSSSSPKHTLSHATLADEERDIVWQLGGPRIIWIWLQAFRETQEVPKLRCHQTISPW